MTSAMRVVLPASTTLFMAFWPGILQLYFATSGAWSLAQSYVLQSNKMRSMLGLTPVVKQDPIVAAEAKIQQLRTLVREAEQEQPARNESSIDKWVGQMKEGAGEKIDAMKIWKSKKSKDDEKKKYERFTASELQEARDWEKKRAEEEDTERGSRNIRMKQEWEALQKRKERQQNRLRRAASKKDGHGRR